MVSPASRGTTERIAARILFKALRAGFGTRAKYSFALFARDSRLAGELRLPDFAFFTRESIAQRWRRAAPSGVKSKNRREISLCAGRRVRQNGRGRKGVGLLRSN